MKDSILVVGGGGLLGQALLALGRRQGWPVRATVRAPTNPSPMIQRLELGEALGSWRPPSDCSVAILCAGVTRLEACRANPAASWHINVTQTLELSRRLADQGVFIVFPSSNLVFDGEQPLQADDAPLRPCTEYGRQKAAVEQGLAELGAPFAIARLTKVVHEQWALLRAWVTALQAGESIAPFLDLRCSPIPLECAVAGVGRIAEQRRPGVWQFSADLEVSYAEVATHLALRLGAAAGLVQPVHAADRLDLEHLPQHTTLDASRTRTELGLKFPPPLEAIDRVLKP